MLKLFLYGMLFMVLPLIAEEGFTQEHLVKVSPIVSDMDVDPNTQVEITFDSEIDEASLTEVFILNSEDTKIGGMTSLSSDKKSIKFTPETSLKVGEHYVELESLKLQGNEQQPCNTFWNRTKVRLCKTFSWKCDDICYEVSAIQTEPVVYSFSVADNTAAISMLNIKLTAKDLNESEISVIVVNALYEDNTTEDVTDSVSWKNSDSSVVKIEGNKLLAQEEGKTQLIAVYNNVVSMAITINVYKTVDEHRLPLEPDETLNNSTLLGIDINNNGVRDDVERWIYLEMEIQYGYSKVERAIGMQKAYGYQMALIDPANTDDKVNKAMEASGDCWTWYQYSKKVHVYGVRGKFSRALKDRVYNTKNRLKTYFQYDATLGGQIFTSMPTLQTRSQCMTDIDKL